MFLYVVDITLHDDSLAHVVYRATDSSAALDMALADFSTAQSVGTSLEGQNTERTIAWIDSVLNDSRV